MLTRAAATSIRRTGAATVASSSRRAAARRAHPKAASSENVVSSCSFSSSGGGGGGGILDDFKPRRRVPRSYRPIPSRKRKVAGPRDPENPSPPLEKQVHVLGSLDDDEEMELTEAGRFYDERDDDKKMDPLVRNFGPNAAAVIKQIRRARERRGYDDVEANLRIADYMTAPMGSTEDLVGERRMLMEIGDTEKEREEFAKELDRAIEEERINQMDFLKWEDDMEDAYPDADEEVKEEGRDTLREVAGDWSETLVQVDRVQKVQRLGTTVRYRALVVGGNTNGCAGFGVGKSLDPGDATKRAIRMCKKNVFFVDRYQNAGLTSDLAGRHNSCRVILRAVQPNFGLKGHELIKTILTYFGITDCSAKSHGNRNQYNVVRATFKAIMTHESMEDIALKRGKRLLNLDRAARLQI